MEAEHWDSGRIPDQTGRVVVVTGSNSGIGKETARVAAAKNASVVIAVRNAKKGEAAARDIGRQYPGADLSVMSLDLASLRSVRDFAEALLSSRDRLDILVNNAGVMFGPYSQTEDGFENQLGTNHLGHFALAGHLLPRLKQTPGSRLVVVSSLAQEMGKLDFADLNWKRRKYSAQRAYGDSKLANMYFAYELARRLRKADDNPRVIAAHPGWTATDLQRHSPFAKVLNRFFAQGVEMGALPTLRAAFDENAKPGDYFGPSNLFHVHGYPQAQKSSKRSYDENAAQRLWQCSEEMTGVVY